MEKGGKKWLNRLETAAAVKVAAKAAVEAEAVEKVAAGPAKPETLPVAVEVTHPQKAKPNNQLVKVDFQYRKLKKVLLLSFSEHFFIFR